MRTAIKHFSLANALACDTSTCAGRPQPSRQMASRTSNCAPSTPIVMSAAMCWIAWNELDRLAEGVAALGIFHRSRRCLAGRSYHQRGGERGGQIHQLRRDRPPAGGGAHYVGDRYSHAVETNVDFGIPRRWSRGPPPRCRGPPGRPAPTPTRCHPPCGTRPGTSRRYGNCRRTPSARTGSACHHRCVQPGQPASGDHRPFGSATA